MGSSLPPGPRMPSALQAVGWAQRPFAFMDRCHKRHGDIFTLRVRRGRPWVLLADPDHIKQVFTSAPGLMGAGAGEANPLLGPLLGPRSVMLLDEPEHMRNRKFMLPSFHGERMRGYGEMMSEVARQEIAKWPTGEPFGLWPRMQAISMEVVMRAVFGGAESHELWELRDLLRRLTDWLNDPRRLTLLTILGSRWLTGNAGFRKVIQPVEASVLAEVRRRRAAPGSYEQNTILALLEQAYDENGTPMTERELRDELITLLSDGPTATSLAWVFERLLRHPEKLERLREEVLRDEGDEYLDACVKETLRLCPAVPLVMRRLAEPMRLGGYAIPADTILAPCVYLVHRHADVYPQPLAFLPERFLQQPAGTYTWIPFGGGARRCVAASFAQMEMKIVMRTVLREVDLRSGSSSSEKAARSSVAFAPGEKARVVLTRRTSSSGSPPHLRTAKAPAGR